MSISTFKPSIRRKEMDAVLSSLVSDKIGPGLIVEDLIKRFGVMFNTDDGMLVRCYEDAINAALSCIDFTEKKKVILSPLVPSVYFDCLMKMGLSPVFTDVDPDSALLTRESVEKAVQEDTACIILHHTNGRIPDQNGIKELELPVIEDISDGFGGLPDENRSNTVGNVVLISMEPENIITSGGGTAVLVREKSYAAALSALKRNMHLTSIMPDMNAALADIQLNHLTAFMGKRNEIFALYTKALMKSKHKTLLQKGDREFCPSTFTVVANSGIKPIIKYATKAGIEVRTAFGASVIAGLDPEQLKCPEASKLSLKCLNFPLYPSLSVKDIELISRILSTLP